MRRELREEIRAELDFHIEEEVERLVAEGLDPEQARRRILREFRPAGRIESECLTISGRRIRRERREAMLQQVWQDLSSAVRSAFKRKGFFAVSVLTFALGIGAAVSIYSVADTMLWRPLAYERPEELVRLGGTWPRGSGIAPLAPPMFFDWQRQSTSFVGLAATQVQDMDLKSEGDPVRFKGAGVSAEFLPILGIRPLLGRWFSGQEDEPGAQRTVVLSHRAWQGRWGADEGILGKPVTLNGSPYTVIGVLPADFHPPQDFGLGGVDVWFPLAFIDADLQSHNIAFLRVLGRLKPGLDLEAARREMGPLSERLIQGYGARDYPEPFRFQIEKLYQSTVRSMGTTLLMLLGAVGLLLFIACFNVAGLQVVRGDCRREELALRTALGASRVRIAQQLLTESLFLAGVGGGLGVLLALLGVKAFVALGPADLPRLAEVSVDGRVLAFAVATSAAAGLLFGLLPVLRTTRLSLLTGLQKGVAAGSAPSPRRSRLRSLFVVVQTAMALVLLAGAGLLANSLARLLLVDPGFDSRDVTVMHVSLASRYETKEQRSGAFGRMLDSLQAVPGVHSIGLANGMPFGESATGGSVVIEGRPDLGDGEIVRWQLISEGFLPAIGVEALPGGRLFSPAEIRSGANVVLLNGACAEKFWPAGGALGQRLKVIRTDESAPWLEVVGVVPDFKQNKLGEPSQPEIYVPYTQPPFIFSYMDFVIRSAPSAQPSARQLRQAVWQVDPQQPVDWVAPLEERISISLARPRFYALLLGLFAGFALVLSAVGVYGTLSFWVNQRTSELAIRMALGASRRRLGADVLRQGLVLVTSGIVIGLAVAAWASQALSGFLYGVSPTDGATLAGVSLFLLLVSAAAMILPASRAMRVDPVIHLRT